MGCGSSSTKIETFRNPEENRAYQNDTHSNRKPASATRRPKSKQSSSSSSRSSSASSKGKQKHKSVNEKEEEEQHHSRNSTANTRRTYTIEQKQVVNDTNDTNEVVNVDAKDNESFKDDTIPHDNIFITSKSTQEQTTDQTTDAVDHDNEVTENQTNDSDEKDDDKDEKIENAENAKAENAHSTRLLEETERIVLENGLCALNIPDIDESRQMKEYNIDELGADPSLFKYGRKVYSNDIMQPIIQERIRQYSEVTAENYWGLNIEGAKAQGVSHPVRLARLGGVTGKELKQLLPVCQVGTFVDLPREDYVARMKQSAESILEPVTSEGLEGEYLADFLEQVSRWLQKYPDVDTENKLSDYNTDPNEVAFPLVIDDPLAFRKWGEEWEPFDTDVPETGAWFSFEHVPLQDASLAPEVHEHFASFVKARNDPSIQDLDMIIEGEAAWNVIELELFKNDSATDGQLVIWALREKRTNLDDRAWMEKRRHVIGTDMISRHEWQAEVLEPYENFAERLEADWKLFQEACEKPYNPPHKYRVLCSTTDEQGDTQTGNTTEYTSGLNPDVLDNDTNDQEPVNADTNRMEDGQEEHVSTENDIKKPNNTIDSSGENVENSNNVEGSRESTRINHNDEQNEDRPTIETMDSGLELDNGDAFYK